MQLNNRIIKEFRGNLAAECFVKDIKPFATDFGGSQTSPPAMVIMARSEEELSTALRIAQYTKTPVHVRGAGHSCYGQTLHKDGIVLFNFSENAGDVILTDDLRINVSGRSYWGNIQRYLRRYTATVPVLTDYMDLTVGGTLSVGGYGLKSIINGSQADSIEAVKLIKPDGSAVWCSKHENRDLFRYCFGTMGQIGIIERAIMRIEESPQKTFIITQQPGDIFHLGSILNHFSENSEILPDHFWAGITSSEIIVQYGFPGESLNDAYDLSKIAIHKIHNFSKADMVEDKNYETTIHQERGSWVEKHTNHYRLWCDYIIDPHHSITFLEFLKEKIIPLNVGVIYVLAIKIKSGTFSPLLPHNFTGSTPSPAIGFGQGKPEMRFGFGVYCMVPAGDRTRMRIAESAHKACLDKCRELGGRPYRYGWCPLTEEEKHDFYGHHLKRLRDLRKSLDPYDILNPGIF